MCPGTQRIVWSMDEWEKRCGNNTPIMKNNSLTYTKKNIRGLDLLQG